ncbi:MAG: cysteine--tRNA ligase [bacterium]|nr:cysteine--tRNA ligase [bacterium]
MINFYDSFRKEKINFIPKINGEVSMYQCGPTVYDNAHIGNLRTYVMSDIIRRVFEYEKFYVRQAMNITDIDDKTIRRSHEQNIKLSELTLKYEEIFFEDLKRLNILKPTIVMRATKYVPQMISIISTLIDKKFAYVGSDGVYFSIDKKNNYGSLAGIKKGAEQKERISNDEYDKENPGDFALWKFWSENDGENSWEAPFGKGRPGWHIECSAMSHEALGQPFDIHTGGIDLIFPHHTNEIAQSEACYDKPLSEYWIHGGFMNVNGEKMAKSKQNFFKLSDIESAGFSPLVYRYFLFSAHYRSQMNFTFEGMVSAKNALEKIYKTLAEISKNIDTENNSSAINSDYKNKFEEAIIDDFNMPKALAIFHDLLNDKNITAEEKYFTALNFDKVFALDFKNKSFEVNKAEQNLEIPENVKKLAEERLSARQNKDWKKADELRLEINKSGFDIIDKGEGYICTII